jgi:hypothetical protein
MESEAGLLPELNDAERRTAILRDYLRHHFEHYVDRRPLAERQTKVTNGPESLKQILEKRQSTNELLKKVEAAASQNLPLEARFERRHEKKDKPRKTANSKLGKTSQQRRSRQVAQKFVEPITTESMIAVDNSPRLTSSLPAKNYRRAATVGAWAGLLVAIMGLIIYMIWR